MPSKVLLTGRGVKKTKLMRDYQKWSNGEKIGHLELVRLKNHFVKFPNMFSVKEIDKIHVDCLRRHKIEKWRGKK